MAHEEGDGQILGSVTFPALSRRTASSEVGIQHGRQSEESQSSRNHLGHQPLPVTRKWREEGEPRPSIKGTIKLHREPERRPEGRIVTDRAESEPSGAKGTLKAFSKMHQPRSRESALSFQVQLRQRRSGGISTYPGRSEMQVPSSSPGIPRHQSNASALPQRAGSTSPGKGWWTVQGMQMLTLAGRCELQAQVVPAPHCASHCSPAAVVGMCLLQISCEMRCPVLEVGPGGGCLGHAVAPSWLGALPVVMSS